MQKLEDLFKIPVVDQVGSAVASQNLVNLFHSIINSADWQDCNPGDKDSSVVRKECFLGFVLGKGSYRAGDTPGRRVKVNDIDYRINDLNADSRKIFFKTLSEKLNDHKNTVDPISTDNIKTFYMIVNQARNLLVGLLGGTPPAPERLLQCNINAYKFKSDQGTAWHRDDVSIKKDDGSRIPSQNTFWPAAVTCLLFRDKSLVDSDTNTINNIGFTLHLQEEKSQNPLHIDSKGCSTCKISPCAEALMCRGNEAGVLYGIHGRGYLYGLHRAETSGLVKLVNNDSYQRISLNFRFVKQSAWDALTFRSNQKLSI